MSKRLRKLVLFVRYIGCVAIGYGTGVYAVHGNRWACVLALIGLFLLILTRVPYE